jgi:hypothetical protein
MTTPRCSCGPGVSCSACRTPFRYVELIERTRRLLHMVLELADTRHMDTLETLVELLYRDRAR